MRYNTNPSKIYKSGDVTIRFTWIPGNTLEGFAPFSQCYGVCFDKNGQIVIQKFKDSDWSLPGGTVEKGELPEETLRREFLEEVDIKLKKVILLGAQKVEYLKGHNPHPQKGGDVFFQLRYYCEVSEVLPQTPDPDKGEIRDRKFIDPDIVTQYFDWGDAGKAIFDQAIYLFHRLHNDSGYNIKINETSKKLTIS
jgi:8-oxo-dGTP pyrophosphatase MutT (NUDIX family)